MTHTVKSKGKKTIYLYHLIIVVVIFKLEHVVRCETLNFVYLNKHRKIIKSRNSTSTCRHSNINRDQESSFYKQLKLAKNKERNIENIGYEISSIYWFDKG